MLANQQWYHEETGAVGRVQARNDLQQQEEQITDAENVLIVDFTNDDTVCAVYCIARELHLVIRFVCCIGLDYF